MSKEEILAILREHIIGDGQGYPDDGEREAAADALIAEMKRRGIPVKE